MAKGINEFVEAGKLLFNKYPNIKLLLVGAEEKNNPDSVPTKYLKNLSLLPFIKWTNLVRKMFHIYMPFLIIAVLHLI